MTGPPEAELIHDWNLEEGTPRPARTRVELDDETLRDGLQSSAATLDEEDVREICRSCGVDPGPAGPRPVRGSA